MTYTRALFASDATSIFFSCWRGEGRQAGQQVVAAADKLRTQATHKGMVYVARRYFEQTGGQTFLSRWFGPQAPFSATLDKEVVTIPDSVRQKTGVLEVAVKATPLLAQDGGHWVKSHPVHSIGIALLTWYAPVTTSLVGAGYGIYRILD